MPDLRIAAPVPSQPNQLSWARHGAVLSPRFPCVLLLVLAGFACLAGCYDPNSIETIALSPDSRYAAVVTTDGELGVIDLSPNGAKVIYSRTAGRGVDWSTHDGRLVFIEKPAEGPYRLMAVDPADGQSPPEMLFTDHDWIADPVWVGPDQIAFLSTREAEDANLWLLDTLTGKAKLQIDRPQEISRAWSLPDSGRMIFQSLERGLPQLWLADLASDEEPRVLPRAEGDDSLEQRLAGFSPDGRAVAIVPGGSALRHVLLYDLTRQELRASREIGGPVESLAILGDGRVALAQNLSLANGRLHPALDLTRLLTTEAENGILLWDPDPGWFGPELEVAAWDNLPLAQLERYGDRGALLGVNTNLLILAEDIESIAEGSLYIRRTEDAIFMLISQARNGHIEAARDSLSRLWDLSDLAGPERNYLLAMARARVERMAGRWDEVLDWLAEATAAEPDDARMVETAWLEYLAAAWFGARDAQRTAWGLQHLPAELENAPLARWVAALQATPAAPETRAWTDAVHALQGGDLTEAARGINRTLSADGPTTIALAGLELILNGDVEPAASAVGVQWVTTDRLLARPEFQQALLTAGREPQAEVGPAPEELRALVLSQWLLRGDVQAARRLVESDLQATGSTNMDYAGMLHGFLEPEEQEPWMERAVSEVLLAEPVEPALTRRLSDAEGRMLIQQARIKARLIAGDMSAARAALEDAVLLIAGPDAQSLPQAEDLFRLTLYQAKVNERQGEWEAAAEGYRAALRWMARDARSWQPSGSELVMAIGLIEQGHADRELLQSYLRIQRGLGDPLINPSHDEATLRTAQDNLATLRRYSRDAVWLAPYLAYSEGMIWSLLRYPMQALESLGEARRLDADPSLLQRVLLEEAAIRESLGQSAARLYERIYRMDLPIAVRGPALLSGIAAEVDAGLASRPGDRLDALAAEMTMPANWLYWLRLQLGADTGQ